VAPNPKSGVSVARFRVNDRHPLISIRNERKREIGERIKTQQRQNTPEDKALLEAASRIIGSVLDASCPHRTQEKDLASLSWNAKGNNQLGVSGIFSADEEEDIDDRESFQSA
jgi:hypothetical protein